MFACVLLTGNGLYVLTVFFQLLLVVLLKLSTEVCSSIWALNQQLVVSGLVLKSCQGEVLVVQTVFSPGSDSVLFVYLRMKEAFSGPLATRDLRLT